MKFSEKRLHHGIWSGILDRIVETEDFEGASGSEENAQDPQYNPKGGKALQNHF